MQTKQEIQQLLACAGEMPKKRLGQHFLIDLNLARLLVDYPQIRADDVVLEVGCGTGSLTEAMALKAGHVIAVDLDPTVTRIAESQLANCSNVEIINADILANKHRINAQVLDRIQAVRAVHRGRLLLVANLPYHIASPLMINLVTAASPVDAMVVTIQKEVGDRMRALPGSGDYGGLSILLQATGHLELVRVLKPTVFWPKPLVDSAIVSYTHSREKAGQIPNMSLFQDVIDLFMTHRRKMLQATVKKADEHLCRRSEWPDIFSKCHVDPTLRPNQLAVQAYVSMARAISQMQQKPIGKRL
jgi:16S rRNA (adenine1518-N6/adenine1519-N6)-dimethyltransferase